MSRITRIRLPSRFTLGATPHTSVADFKLGMGPCGKEVVQLFMRQDVQGSYEVHQTTSDREEKVFIYPVETITGRIEVTYGDSLGDDIEGEPSIG